MKKILALTTAVILTFALCVSAAAIHNPDDTTQVWRNTAELALSFDTFYVDGVSHMDLGWGADGEAHAKLSEHPLTITSEEKITVRGWAGIKGDPTVTVFGYRINEGTAVYNEAFSINAEDAVKAAGGDSRFQIDIPVKGLTDPTLITAVAKGDDGKEYDFIEFSINGQYAGSGSEQPAAPDTPLFSGSVSTGWWMNPFTEKEWTINATFDTPNAFDGFAFRFYANGDAGAKVKVNLLDKDGATVEATEFTAISNGEGNITFSKAYAPGTYTIQFKSTDSGAHFVLGSAAVGDIAVTMDTDTKTNSNTQEAPAITLHGAVVEQQGGDDNPGENPGSDTPVNPGTADASVIAIAAVACVALAGVVIAKKVR